ncbi:helix-turn-helix transcriptional regulator [Streptomyces sp. NPDC006872]|uniref:helix-turn-helix transcriptional regulator n=1 Tax=Streptomyces sp. NPDC006872 TaxID=3155720 RepID=UPI0033FFAC33
METTMDIPETTRTIARRVKELRTRQGITAEQLAHLLSGQGIHWDRFAVANLEKERRKNLTVGEMLALARVLHVSPVHLIVPPTNEGTFQVTPEEACPPSDARAWIRGSAELPRTDRRIFRTEVPFSELGQSWA